MENKKISEFLGSLTDWNMHTVPMIFRNDQVQEQYCKLVKEFRNE